MKKVIDEALDVLRVVDRFDLEEVDLEYKGMRFQLSRGSEPVPEAAPAAKQPAQTEKESPARVESEAEDQGQYATLTSPMVGMFYRSPSPDKPPFVDIGQTVELEQPVCIVEAMKLMNVINSNVRGRIKKIMVENQTPVQAGQVLFLVEPL